jgi:sporulation protein YlmC with PRC-barrel domain
MLIKAKTLKGYKLNSLDAEVGTVKEFYFDDQFWTIRYLIANSGNWLTGRQVLISPYALSMVNIPEELIDINLTKKQIEDSPPLSADKPVSRQFEVSYYNYYGFPLYWAGPNMWGYYPYIVRDSKNWDKSLQVDEHWDPNLRSTFDVTGHKIQASDGEIGHVEDFIIDVETWTIRYLVIDTKNWWTGKKVLVSPHWIDRISWGESKVFVNLLRESIALAPEYIDDLLLTRDYEANLHQFYKKSGYWYNEPAVKVH